MGLSSRMFFLEEDGSFRSIPWSRYLGLYQGDPSVRFPEYAQKAVKCVSVLIELEDRTPISVIRTDFFVTYFDKFGGIDERKKEEALRLAVNMAGPDFVTEPRAESVIDASRRLYKKRYGDRFKWTPAAEERAKIERLIDKIFAR